MLAMYRNKHQAYRAEIEDMKTASMLTSFNIIKNEFYSRDYCTF